MSQVHPRAVAQLDFTNCRYALSLESVQILKPAFLILLLKYFTCSLYANHEGSALLMSQACPKTVAQLD